MRWLGIVTAACIASACAEETTNPTELIVVVDTDIPVPGELDSIGLEITGSDGSVDRIELDLGRVALPASLVLHPAGQSLGPVGVVAIGRMGGTPMVWSRVLTGFVRNEKRLVHVVLWRTCRAVGCSASETCDPDTTMCVDATAPAASLPRWTGTFPPIEHPEIDGGPGPDGGPRDGGPCTDFTMTCSGGMERTRCGGMEISVTPCALGCSRIEPNRCARVRSSFVTPDLFDDTAGDVVPPGTIDTDACSAPARATTQASGNPVCLIAGRNVTFSAPVRVVGRRPLIVLATGDVTISAIIDASAIGSVPGGGGHVGGVGEMQGEGEHAGDAAPYDDAAPGGGLCGRGGDAGSYPTPPAGPSAGGSFVGAPAALVGGSGGGGAFRTAGGAGGGAIAIAARGTIAIMDGGGILAGGGGGGRGHDGTEYAGGGGGGSGGMIVLEALAIDARGIIGAPGGGGGGGGALGPGVGSAGDDGGPAARSRIDTASGGTPSGMWSGAGGRSGGGDVPNGAAGGNSGSVDAPGGGGGGAGCILLRDATGSADVGRGFFTPRLPTLLRSVVPSE